MKKFKQIMAILGIVLIIGLNFMLVFAAFGATETDNNTFLATIVSVIMIPVLLWIYLYIFKLVKKNSDKKPEDETKDL